MNRKVDLLQLLQLPKVVSDLEIICKLLCQLRRRVLRIGVKALFASHL